MIIAIGTQKGGVAKTTSVVNIAAVAARALGPNKVLVVDVDPQANATGTLLDIATSNGPRDKKRAIVLDVLMGKIALTSALRIREFPAMPGQGFKSSNLHLLPSHPELGEIELELVSRQKIGALADVLDEVKDFYDLILIDCPPNLGAFTRSALMAADGVIIPVAPGPYELVGVALLQQVIREYQSSPRLNPSLRLIGVLPTMFDNTNISKDAKAAIDASFGNLVLPAIPRRADVKMAAAAGMDVLTYNPTSDATAAYGAATAAILRRAGIIKKKEKVVQHEQ